MAGAGYKLFNTGDVLTAAQVNTYLMQQTVMVFASSAARTSALSGVLAEGMVSYLQDTNTLEVYDGSAWVGATGDITGLTAGTGISISSATGPVPTITNSVATTFDALGDLVVGTGADTFSKLTVGANGESIVANSSASVGLSWNPSVAAGAKNFVINGSMDFWQRGTSSFVGASPYYTADRWQAFKADNSSGFTFSQQTASLDGFTYSLRAQRNSGNTATASAYICTSFESIDARRAQGQKLTLSFWAKAGANYSPTSSLLQAAIVSGTGTDGNLAAGFTSQATIGSSNVTLTTSWQKFTVTTTNNVASTVTQLGIFFKIDPTGTAGANDWVEITGVQLEIGSVATSFARAGGTLAGELAACQRYYYRQNWQALSNYAVFGIGFANTTGACYIETTFPVNMRVKPTAVDTAAMSAYAFEVGTTYFNTPTTIAIDSNYSSPNNGTLAITKAGSFAVGTYYRMGANNNSGAYIGWSAEL